MQTNYLKYFDDVVRLGSIAAAAEENHMSPQGVSKSLSVLEAELGCKLFVRQSNRLVPSAYGARIAPLACRALATEQEMFEEVAKVHAASIGSSDKGIVAFVNNVAFDSAFIKPLFAGISDLFARTRFFQCDNEEVLRCLLTGPHRDDEISLGLFCFFSPLEEENKNVVTKLIRNGFVYRPYLRSHDCALVSASSSLAEKRALTRSDMVNHPLIASNNDIRAVLEHLYGKESIRIVGADGARLSRVGEAWAGNQRCPGVLRRFRQMQFRLQWFEEGSAENPYYLEIGFALPASVENNKYIEQFFIQLNAFLSPAR